MLRLMLGLMLCTMFWSMWLSATVCTVTMVPIVTVLVDKLGKVCFNTNLTLLQTLNISSEIILN